MVLLTALPRTGKSIAIKKIVNMLGRKNCGGFYTEEITENGERVGFKIISLRGKNGILAHVSINSEYRISRYGVDLETFERICLKELKYAISSNDVKYIIIDEIGPMQLFSEEYKDLLYLLLSCDKPIIGTIFYSSHDWLDEFKRQPNVNLVEINIDNRDYLPLEIVDNISNDDLEFQRKINKARRYIKEAERFSFKNNKLLIYSEHGVREITFQNDRYYCNCEYFKENDTCSHIISSILFAPELVNFKNEVPANGASRH